jgi:glycosyltransferase involved in cell wall biosynthesis
MHRNVVVVHRGRRDAYQVAGALAEANRLECLVTDLYWPNGQVVQKLPLNLQRLLLLRHSPLLDGKNVQQTFFMGAISQLLDMLPNVPFSWRKRATRRADTALGNAAGKLAARTGSLLLSYSYYGYQSFSVYGEAGILFQAHPHPASIQRILRQELTDHPECASSLEKEWELCLPADDFKRLVDEPAMASYILAASSFTRRTLIENGIAAQVIHVVPYGVDLECFLPAPQRESNGKLRLLFVGTITQRKGIKYLLEALRMQPPGQVELTVCGRVVDDLALFEEFAAQITIRPSVSLHELVDAYQQADLFVFPSVAEGFGQVLLEALACGLPILSTTNTAAPDLIDDGVQGFIVEPRRADQIAGRIQWALRHRTQLAEMRAAARTRAEQFTWKRFRAGVLTAVARFEDQIRVQS